MKLVITYTLFAIMATLANFFTQAVVFHFWQTEGRLLLSMGCGTLIGLIIKYILDKRYIFQFQTHSLQHDTHVFMLYMLVSIITTVLFWGAELGFYYVFEQSTWRYLGASLGLLLGYTAKYYLDKRYVFREVSNP